MLVFVFSEAVRTRRKTTFQFVKNHPNHEAQLKEFISIISLLLQYLNCLMSYRVLLIKLTHLLEKLEYHSELEELLFESV